MFSQHELFMNRRREPYVTCEEVCVIVDPVNGLPNSEPVLFLSFHSYRSSKPLKLSELRSQAAFAGVLHS